MSFERPPEVLSGFSLVTYHCRMISRGLDGAVPSQKRATATILRQVADVFDEIYPEPAPLPVHPYQELLRLSVAPSRLSPDYKRAQPVEPPRPKGARAPLPLHSTYHNAQHEEQARHFPARKRAREAGVLGNTGAAQLSKRSKFCTVDNEDTTMTQRPVLVTAGVNQSRGLQAAAQQELGSQLSVKPIHVAPSKDSTLASHAPTHEDGDSLFIPERTPIPLPSPNLSPEDDRPYLQVSQDTLPLAKKSIKKTAISCIPDSARLRAGEVNPTPLASQDTTTTKSRRRVTRSTSLKAITYSLTAEVSQNDIVQCRDSFFSQLSSLEVDVRVCGKQETHSFTAEEATDITNLLFTDLVGWPAMKRVQTLLTEYNERPDNCAGLQGIARAEQLANEASTPQPFKDLFGSLSRANRYALNGTVVSKGPVHVNTIKSIIESVKTHQFYTKIMAAAAQNDPDLERYLIAQGYKDKKAGSTWKSVARLFIRETMGYSNSALDLQCQQAEIVSFMVELFGNGIIPIFPVQAVWRLRKWGIQRMKSALWLYKKVFPKLKMICVVLDHYVYQPIETGLPIPMSSKKLSAQFPLVELINSAVNAQDQRALPAWEVNESVDDSPPSV